MNTTLKITTIGLIFLTHSALAKTIKVKKQGKHYAAVRATKGEDCPVVYPVGYGSGSLYLSYEDGANFQASCNNESYQVAHYDPAQWPQASCWSLEDLYFTTCQPAELKSTQLDLYAYEILTYSKGHSERERTDGIAITTHGDSYFFGGISSIEDSSGVLGAGSTQITNVKVETTQGTKIKPYISYYNYSW